MKEEDWDIVINPKTQKKVFDLKELSRYRDLILLFVKRDFISIYKQTILGPIWVVIQPVLTTFTFYVVFNRIAGIDTGIDPLLFYMLGVTTWTYFADCVTKTSDTFIENQKIFGKVYFPRLIMPFSVVMTNLIKFAVQLALFLVFYFYFFFFTDAPLSPNINLLLFPVLILTMAGLGLGVGLIIASMTIKYRDLRFLIKFGVQLAMYVTPVVYPLSSISTERQWILQLNPMTNIIETFKAGFFGTDFGVMDYSWLGYSILFTFIVLLVGMRIFGRVEKTFMDSI